MIGRGGAGALGMGGAKQWHQTNQSRGGRKLTRSQTYPVDPVEKGFLPFRLASWLLDLAWHLRRLQGLRGAHGHQGVHHCQVGTLCGHREGSGH